MGREENYPFEASSRGTVTTSRRRNSRCPVKENGGGEPTVECSGECCRSCAAGVIADCVAVCCCPCAVINCFTLAFLKVPWMMGKRCLGLGNKKKKKLKHDLKLKKDMEGISRKEWGEEGISGNTVAGAEEEDEEEEEEEKDKYSARFEAEKVWLELYKVDHLGFGRVSFTGIQSLG